MVIPFSRHQAPRTNQAIHASSDEKPIRTQRREQRAELFYIPSYESLRDVYPLHRRLLLHVRSFIHSFNHSCFHSFIHPASHLSNYTTSCPSFVQLHVEHTCTPTFMSTTQRQVYLQHLPLHIYSFSSSFKLLGTSNWLRGTVPVWETLAISGTVFIYVPWFIPCRMSLLPTFNFPLLCPPPAHGIIHSLPSSTMDSLIMSYHVMSCHIGSCQIISDHII